MSDRSHHCDYLGHEDLFCTVLLCILALAGQLSRMKILASDQRIFFFSFRAKPTGPQQFQPPLWLHWPHAERAEPTGLCRQLLALPRPDLSPLEIFIVITLVFHHYQALGYVAGS